LQSIGVGKNSDPDGIDFVKVFRKKNFHRGQTDIETIFYPGMFHFEKKSDFKKIPVKIGVGKFSDRF